MSLSQKRLGQVERLLQIELDQMGDGGRLRDACSYAVLSPGKRFRPLLVFMVADALKGAENALDAAVAVEFFHAASLIADDLPCMDDDQERRSRPSTHVQFDEATAILATYALIAQGYDCLARGGNPSCALAAIRNVSFNTGLMGAAGGQYLDLFMTDASVENQMQVVEKKTVTLFEMSFVLGWIYGGGDAKFLPKVKEAAKHFGVAFQLADDLDDYDQDVNRTGSVNLAVSMGIEKTSERIQLELDLYLKKIKQLDIETTELQGIAEAVRVKTDCYQ